MITDRTKALIEELTPKDVVEVLGVVQASGSSGSCVGQEKSWTFRFAFEAWKYPNGAIQNRKLTVCKVVSKEEIRSYMAQIRPYDVLRIRARVAEENSLGSPQGLLVEIICKDASDAELHHFALKLQQPIIFEDARLGVFTLDRRLNWYEAKTSWGSTSIRLSLPTDDRQKIKQFLANAYLLWDAQESWIERITNFAAAKLLGLKNNAWLGEDEVEFSAEQFKGKMKLESISVKSNGDFEFWFEDGNLFWGHAIRVAGNLSSGPSDAEIAG